MQRVQTLINKFNTIAGNLTQDSQTLSDQDYLRLLNKLELTIQKEKLLIEKNYIEVEI